MRKSWDFILQGTRSLGRIYSRAVTCCILERSLWPLCGEWIERVKEESHITSLENPSRQDRNKQWLQTCKNKMWKQTVWKEIHQKAYRGFLGYGIKNK